MVKLLFQKMGKKVKKIIIRSKLFSISNYFIEFSFYFEVLKHIVMNIKNVQICGCGIRRSTSSS